MGKVTKAAGNRYCIARLAAATCNDCFGSREGAAYATGIDRTRLARIEIGTVTPLPEEVRVLADAYNTPELLNYYCSHDCQIGRCMDILLPEEAPSCIEQIAVQAAVALRNAEHIRDSLMDISADGVIDPEERVELDRILAQLGQISQVAHQLNAVARKLRGEGDA